VQEDIVEEEEGEEEEESEETGMSKQMMLRAKGNERGSNLTSIR
jgi:hypothetical protein